MKTLFGDFFEYRQKVIIVMQPGTPRRL